MPQSFERAAVLRATAYLRQDAQSGVLRIYDGAKRIKQKRVGPASDPESEAKARRRAQGFNDRQKAKEGVRAPGPLDIPTWKQVLADYERTYVPQLSKGTRKTDEVRPTLAFLNTSAGSLHGA